MVKNEYLQDSNNYSHLGKGLTNRDLIIEVGTPMGPIHKTEETRLHPQKRTKAMYSSSASASRSRASSLSNYHTARDQFDQSPPLHFIAPLPPSMRSIFDAIWASKHSSVNDKLRFSDHVAKLLTPSQSAAYERWKHRKELDRNGSDDSGYSSESQMDTHVVVADAGNRPRKPDLASQFPTLPVSPGNLTSPTSASADWSAIASTPLSSRLTTSDSQFSMLSSPSWSSYGTRSSSYSSSPAKRTDSSTSLADAMHLSSLPPAFIPLRSRSRSLHRGHRSSSRSTSRANCRSRSRSSPESVSDSDDSRTPHVDSSRSRSRRSSSHRSPSRSKKSHSRSRARSSSPAQYARSLNIRSLIHYRIGTVTLKCKSLIGEKKHDFSVTIDVFNTPAGEILRRLATGRNSYGEGGAASKLEGNNLAGMVNCFMASYVVGEYADLRADPEMAEEEDKQTKNAHPGQVFIYTAQRTMRISMFVRLAHTKDASRIAGVMRQLPSLPALEFGRKRRLETVTIAKCHIN
ncbi:hypothetical protein WR25_04137 [Diploscapter pachys]|uniref:Uncharacterized protein n=1 Tax=Diploscapter pachys TaxID=2018661 RepID=A0A2A2JV05_9BILA|nr:hypothetical protein WR25_04137 [Diploscapter pachys]